MLLLQKFSMPSGACMVSDRFHTGILNSVKMIPVSGVHAFGMVYPCTIPHCRQITIT